MAEDRILQRRVDRAVRAARRWKVFVVGLSEADLLGLNAAIGQELENRGLVDRTPRHVRL
jgi:hypothetical protein